MENVKVLFFFLVVDWTIFLTTGSGFCKNRHPLPISWTVAIFILSQREACALDCTWSLPLSNQNICQCRGKKSASKHLLLPQHKQMLLCARRGNWFMETLKFTKYFRSNISSFNCGNLCSAIYYIFHKRENRVLKGINIGCKDGLVSFYWSQAKHTLFQTKIIRYCITPISNINGYYRTEYTLQLIKGHKRVYSVPSRAIPCPFSHSKITPWPVTRLQSETLFRLRFRPFQFWPTVQHDFLRNYF